MDILIAFVVSIFIGTNAQNEMTRAALEVTNELE